MLRLARRGSTSSRRAPSSTSGRLSLVGCGSAALSKGLVRFGALHRSLAQISRKVLTEELRELEGHGIVQRTSRNDEATPRVEYALTEYGHGLAPVVESLCDWGAAHLARGGEADAAGR